jgi:ATP-dependent Clp protease ATP-binding subunit ClpX
LTGGRKTPGSQAEFIDTTNILFIAAGAFVGLDEIVEKDDRPTMGFAGVVEKKIEKKTKTKDVTPDDLQEFGLIPEFIGRFPVVCQLTELDEDALCSVLTEPKNSILKQYQALLELDGVELEFEEKAIKAVAKLAYENKTGARGLRAIIERCLRETMFTIPDLDHVEKVIVSEKVVTKGQSPKLVYAEKEAVNEV